MYSSTNYNQSSSAVAFQVSSLSRELQELTTDDILLPAELAPIDGSRQSLTTKLLQEVPLCHWVVCADPEAFALGADGELDGIAPVPGDLVLLAPGVCRYGGAAASLELVVPHAINTLVVVREGATHARCILLSDGANWLRVVGGSSTQDPDTVLLTETGGPNDAVSLVGPHSVPPRLRVRYLQPGYGIKLETQNDGSGVAVRWTSPDSIVLGPRDVVQTDGGGWLRDAWQTSSGFADLCLPSGGGVSFQLPAIILPDGAAAAGRTYRLALGARVPAGTASATVWTVTARVLNTQGAWVSASDTVTGLPLEGDGGPWSAHPLAAIVLSLQPGAQQPLRLTVTAEPAPALLLVTTVLLLAPTD